MRQGFVAKVVATLASAWFADVDNTIDRHSHRLATVAAAKILLCLVALAGSTALAQSSTNVAADRVWLAPSKPTEAQSRWYPQSVSTITGKVITLDNQQFAIQVIGDEVPTRIAAHRVIWIEPGNLSDKESAALKLFADGDYAGALRPLIDSLSERPPVWRQQWLSMLAANAAWRSGRGEIALELVSQLDGRPLAPYVLAWLPVAWQTRKARAGSIQAAEKKLADDSSAVRLVAASWLITSHRGQAVAVLKQLSVDTNRPVVARLAQCVLWRAATPPEVTAHGDDWQQKLDQLPIVLQTGPTLTLAEKLDSAGLDRDAKQLLLSLELTRAIPYPIN